MSASNGECSKTKDCTEQLAEQEWYWGEATKETLAAAMENAPDGTFAVRTASTKGDFTLTIRTGGATKLVRVRVSSEIGKCGFTPETMEFDSVVDLLEHYKGASLKEFNEALDVRLQFPLKRPDFRKISKSTDESSNKKATQVLKCQLEGMHVEYERVSQRYDHLFEQRTEYAELVARKNQAYAAYGEGEKEYLTQIERLRGNLQQNGVGENTADTTDANNHTVADSLKSMEAKAKSMEELKRESKRWVTALEEAVKAFDEELDKLRPRLVYAHRKRDDCMLKLRDLNVHEEHIENILADVSAILSLETERITLTLLHIPLKWDADTWFTTNRNKESAQKAIQEQMKKLPEDKRNGVFLVRPSQTHSGFFALSISMGRTVQSALIEYKDPTKGGDTCGFGFHSTNMFFATLADFVRYYTAYTLKEHNPVLDTTLNVPAFASAEELDEVNTMA